MKKICTAIVISLLFTNTAFALNDENPTTTKNTTNEENSIESLQVASRVDTHTAQFKEDFNSLPPAVKLSLLMSAFKQYRFQ